MGGTNGRAPVARIILRVVRVFPFMVTSNGDIIFASQVDYGGFKTDQMPFKAYLNDLSSVTKNEFDSWSRNRRLAFLINAYNAYTIELILTRYPGLSSIKDLGSFLSSPWKKKFFTLFGKETSLDGIEHDMIRARGEYDEPRIHFSVVCASIGCPGIRNSAYTEVNLEAYLEDSMKRFLSDPTRNRYNPQSGKLEVSMIFKWYGKDFSTGGDGYQSLKGLFGKYAHLLTNAVEAQEKIRKKSVEISFLDYDWNLNNT